ncbi:MAG: radical SAM protein [Elusimicrobiota bacterium]
MKHGNRKRILLLNPPGSLLYLRDYWCSTVSKAGYYWPPIDLLIMSGILGQEHEVIVIDAIVQGLNPDVCKSEIKAIAPDVIIFLSSVLSYDEDMSFIGSIDGMEDILTIGCGEVFIDGAEKVLAENPFINGAVIDFTSKKILALIDDPDCAEKVIVPEEDTDSKYFEYPLPQFKKFPLGRYRYPCDRSKPFTSILTNYGCPYSCVFCNSGSSGFKLRKHDEILRELKDITGMGIKQVFIADMTFAADREHAVKFCKDVVKEGIKIDWHCYSRADIIDEELLVLMKEAGCYLIQFGIESADCNIMKKYKKNIPTEKILQTFMLLKKYRMMSGAHFIFGLPGEKKNASEESLELAMEIDPDYVSFNIFYPRKKTGLAGIRTGCGSVEVEKAVKTAYKRFYCRPSYIIRKILKVRTFYELKNLILTGYGLGKNILSYKKGLPV